MGPPRTRQAIARPPSRSRFQEGSMNDRASAAPPIQFLGAQDPATVFLDKSNSVTETVRPISLDGLGSSNNSNSNRSSNSTLASEAKKMQASTTSAREKASTRGGNLLGQMWDGFRGRLRLRKDAGGAEEDGGGRMRARKVLKTMGSKDGDDDEAAAAATAAGMPGHKGAAQRPTRDEIFDNYQQLVASGFFSSHAIYSTRQPGNGQAAAAAAAPPPPLQQPPAPSIALSRPPTSPGPAPMYAREAPAQRPSTAHASPPPQWPLPTMPLTPSSAAGAGGRQSSPVRSPTSASSRGTKRPAVDDEEEEESTAGAQGRGAGTSDDVTGAVRSSVAKRLRKSASRDIAMPKLRSVTSRRAILSRRSLSAVNTTTGAASAPREPNKLTKRDPRPPLEVPERNSSARRNVSECVSAGCGNDATSTAAHADQSSSSSRVLRPRKSAAEPLSVVVPNANQGIPSVPSIPSKYTFGEDRENGGPWRGLRR